MTDDGSSFRPANPAETPAPRPDPSIPQPRKPSAAGLVWGIALLLLGQGIFQLGQQMQFQEALNDLANPYSIGGDGGTPAVVIGILIALLGLLLTVGSIARLARQIDITYNRAIGAPANGN